MLNILLPKKNKVVCIYALGSLLENLENVESAELLFSVNYLFIYYHLLLLLLFFFYVSIAFCSYSLKKPLSNFNFLSS